MLASKNLFNAICSVTLLAEQYPNGRLIIDSQFVDAFPLSLVLEGIVFAFSYQDSDREMTGTTPENKNEPYNVWAVYERRD